MSEDGLDITADRSLSCEHAAKANATWRYWTPMKSSNLMTFMAHDSHNYLHVSVFCESRTSGFVCTSGPGVASETNVHSQRVSYGTEQVTKNICPQCGISGLQ